MKVVSWVAFVLVVVGGLNWGLVGFFEYNLVEALVGQWPMVVRSVYGLVGLAALWKVFTASQCCKKD